MQDFIEGFVDRLRAEYPQAVAVVLKGSHARGKAKPWSDIDFDVLLGTQGVEEYRIWIEPVGDRLVHISAAVESLDAWIADGDRPSPWSLGFPTVETTKLLWAIDDEHRELLDHPWQLHPAHEIELEDTMEALGKMRNALNRGDHIGVYRNAAKLATLIPTMLVPVNPAATVSNSREAIDAVLALENVPGGFAQDWLTCMGYVDKRTPESTLEAAARMFYGSLDLLPSDEDVVGEDFSRLLGDGTLLAYLTQDEDR